MHTKEHTFPGFSYQRLNFRGPSSGNSNRVRSGLNILDLQVLQCILERLVNVVAVLVMFLLYAPLIFLFLFILKIELSTRER